MKGKYILLVRSISILLSVYVLLLRQGYAQQRMDSLKRSAIGKPFPSFEVLYNNGKINNATAKGKVLLANFWFESCIPCRAEFRILNHVYDSLKATGQFTLVAFTFEQEAVIQKMRKEYGLHFPMVSISKEMCRQLGAVAFPTNIIADKNGNIVYCDYGGPSDPVKAEEKVRNNVLPKILALL